MVGFVTLLFNPAGGWFMYVLFGLYGFSAYPIYAIAVAHANDFAKHGEFGRVAGGDAAGAGYGARDRPRHRGAGDEPLCAGGAVPRRRRRSTARWR